MTDQPEPFAGIPINVDPTLPDGVFELRDGQRTWRFVYDPDAQPEGDPA